MARRCWSCTNSIPRRKLSTVPSPGWRVGCPRRSRNWTSFSSPWARAWDGHEVVDLAVGRLALHYGEENPFDVAMNVIEHNRQAWNRESRRGSRWSTPVTPDVIRAARSGVWGVILTPTKIVPVTWFPDL